MRISELAQETGQSVATLKFYLRLGVLTPGRNVSRTLAQYGPEHVERVRLVRALTDVGGLDLATVARILAVVDHPDAGRLDVLKEAQDALAPVEQSSVDRARALDWLARRGWRVAPGAPAVDQLAVAWRACDDASLGLDERRLDAYADACEQVAREDVASVPPEPAAAVRQVVLGTLLIDPVLAALRRLAQQHLSRTGELAQPPEPAQEG